MTKRDDVKKKDKSIGPFTIDDTKFIDNVTKDFSLSYPDEIDDAINRLKQSLEHPQSEPGLTPIEFLLREFEEEARAILIKAGYSINLDDLYWTMKSASSNVQIANAIKILFQTRHIRDDISNNDGETIAIDTLKLVFAAINANLHEMIFRGIRAKVGYSKGGKIPKRRYGIMKAIKIILPKNKRKDALSLFLYLTKNHNGLVNALDIAIKNGIYKVFTMFDPKTKKAGIFQIFGRDEDDLDRNEQQKITLSTFRRYVSEVKKELKINYQ